MDREMRRSAKTTDFAHNPFEALEDRVLLAGDLAGTYGEYASLVFDQNDTSLVPASNVGSITKRLGEVVGDRFYFDKTVTKVTGEFGYREYTTQVWSTDGTPDGVRLEATVRRSLEFSSTPGTVNLEEVDGVLFAAVTWNQISDDELFTSLWSNASGQFLQYGQTGGLLSLNRTEDEIYLEVDNTWYNSSDSLFRMIRTSPVTRKTHVVWERTLHLGSDERFFEYEDVPEFTHDQIDDVLKEWPDRIRVRYPKTTDSIEVRDLEALPFGVALLSDDGLYQASADSGFVTLWEGDTIELDVVGLDEQNRYAVFDETGQIQRETVEPGRVLLSFGKEHLVTSMEAEDPSTIKQLPAKSNVLRWLGRVGVNELFASYDQRKGIWSVDNEGSSQLIVDDNLFFRGESSAQVLGDRLVIRANATGSTGKIWTTDGTKEGTVPIGRTHSDVVIVDDRMFFIGTDRRLWLSDGTIDGTFQSTILPEDSRVRSLVAFRDKIVFADDRGQFWKSDGTESGSTLITDSQSSMEHVVSNDRLFFLSSDGVHGGELWVSDGTREGTNLAVDINPSGSSRPTDLVASDGRLYFAADDGVHGRELWQVDVASAIEGGVDRQPGDSDGDGVVTFADFLVLSNNFGTETDRGHEDGDHNRDGLVNFADFLILSQNYNRTNR